MHRVPKNLRQTHLEFYKEATMALIGEDFYMEHLVKNVSPKKRKHAEAFVDEIAPTTLDAAFSSCYGKGPSAKKQKQALPKMRCSSTNDKSLHPKTWNWSCRLKKSVCHLSSLPIIKIAGRAKCGLHSWLGFNYCSNLSCCEGCNIHLCMHCYKLFHTETDLVSQKDYLKSKLDLDKLCNRSK
jgi:hypothetical protein